MEALQTKTCLHNFCREITTLLFLNQDLNASVFVHLKAITLVLVLISKTYYLTDNFSMVPSVLQTILAYQEHHMWGTLLI